MAPQGAICIFGVRFASILCIDRLAFCRAGCATFRLCGFGRAGQHPFIVVPRRISALAGFDVPGQVAVADIVVDLGLQRTG